MKLSKEELLKKLSESDNVELMEDIQDSWIEDTPKITEDDFNNLKSENDKLKNDYEELKTKYKERFFERVVPEEKPKINEGLHEEKIFRVDNIFEEVKKYG